MVMITMFIQFPWQSSG